MTTRAFLETLRAHASMPLAFRLRRHALAPGYHLTEIKRVLYETMDCGALSHRWQESQFEVWVPESDENFPEQKPMAAAKFLRIVDRVQSSLPLEEDAVARIHAEILDRPAALYDIDSVAPRQGMLWVELSADRTRCKARERQNAETGSACCRPRQKTAGHEAVGEGCGCDESPRETVGTACCS